MPACGERPWWQPPPSHRNGRSIVVRLASIDPPEMAQAPCGEQAPSPGPSDEEEELQARLRSVTAEPPMVVASTLARSAHGRGPSYFCDGGTLTSMGLVMARPAAPSGCPEESEAPTWAVRVRARSSVLRADHGPSQVRMLPPPLCAELPPGLSRMSSQEPFDREEDIQHAGILPDAALPAEPEVEIEWIAADQIGRAATADRLEGPGNGGTDVGQVGELLEPFTVAAVWMQSGCKAKASATAGPMEKPGGRATGLPGRGHVGGGAADAGAWGQGSSGVSPSVRGT